MAQRKWISIFILIFIGRSLPAQDEVIWKNLRPSKDLDMRVLDDFEERVKWGISNSLAIESTLRFVDNNPLARGLQNYANPKVEKIFQKEVDLLADSAGIHDRSFSKAQRSSQELIVFFSNPGIDYQVIEISEKDKHFITGRPVAMSMWVYGKNKKHVLYALFSNQVNEKIPVKIGDLNFQGWRRLEVPVPVSVSHRNRLNRRVYEFRFDGFKIASHPKEAAGSFSFLHDLVCILIDTRGDDYAGSDIKDNWK